MQTKALVASSLALLVSAKNIDVQVGAHGLTYEPNSTAANPGDMINFHVFQDHNVAQATFDAPCKPIGDNAIYSGYMDQQFTFAVSVNSSAPAWFYCGTGPHCSLGMVFALNPTSNETIGMYASKAQSAGMGVNPSTVGGGTVNKEESSSSSGSPAATSSSTPAKASGSPAPSASSSGVDALSCGSGKWFLITGLSSVLVALGLL